MISRKTSKPWSKAWTEKCIEPDALTEKVRQIREQGRSIATLNGSFDLLHAGHLYILFEAAKQADILLVALNSDISIRTYKGPDRPLIPLQYRLELLAAIEFVDFLTWFNETDPCRILAQIKPDVHVNGAEYGRDCIESETVLSYGGRLHLVERIDGLSTSNIIKKLKHVAV